MRKISAYARKQRRLGETYNGAAAFNAIQRCRAYTLEPLPGMESVEGTQSAANRAITRVRGSFEAYKQGIADAQGADFDVIAHALGVSWIRAVQIAGTDEFDNPMLPIIRAATDAMARSKQRWERLGRWGFDGPAIEEVEAGIDLYQTILQSSSPAQMEAASLERSGILEGQQ